MWLLSEVFYAMHLIYTLAVYANNYPAPLNHFGTYLPNIKSKKKSEQNKKTYASLSSSTSLISTTIFP